MVFLGKVPRFKRAAPLELDLSRKCLPVRVLVIGSKSFMHCLVAVVGDLRQATFPVRNCTTRRHAMARNQLRPKALDCTTQAQYMCLLVQCVTLRPELGTRNEGGRQTQSTRNEGGRQTPRTQGQGRLNHLSEACPTSSRSTYLGRPGCSRQSSPGQTSQSRFDQARLTHGVDSTEQWLLCLATASSTRSLPPPLLSASIYRPRRAGSKLRKRLSMPTNGG